MTITDTAIVSLLGLIAVNTSHSTLGAVAAGAGTVYYLVQMHRK